jgi:hypothetical protein
MPDAPPTGGVATLGPASATESDELHCKAEGAVDSDGDAVLWTYVWTVNGALVDAEEPELAGGFFDKGDTVRCTARPGAGEAVDSNSVQIGSAPPSVASAAVQPGMVGRLETLACPISGLADLDPVDAPTVMIGWLLLPDDALLSTGSELSPAPLQPGALVRCRVTPSDGESVGAPVISTPATIVNYPPQIQDIAVTPAAPTVDETLVCSASAADLDQDPIALLFSWRPNGQLLSAAKDTKLSGVVLRGDAITCVATPDDGFDLGPGVPSDPVIIVNSPPTLTVEIPGGVWCQPFQ